MKNYKQGFALAAIWAVICIIGISANPEKTGFAERPVETILWLCAPVVFYFLLVFVIALIKGKR